GRGAKGSTAVDDLAARAVAGTRAVEEGSPGARGDAHSVSANGASCPADISSGGAASRFSRLRHCRCSSGAEATLRRAYAWKVLYLRCHTCSWESRSRAISSGLASPSRSAATTCSISTRQPMTCDVPDAERQTYKRRGSLRP